jgi:hypothetical protein
MTVPNQGAFQAALAAFAANGGDLQQLAADNPTFFNASSIGLDRLVRKEVALGQIREIEPPQDHIGLQLFAPFMEVATDDVVFEYVTVDTDGLAPARAEDAESELAQKDERNVGQGRASIIDWSLKDHYTASDVNRYRELNRIIEAMKGGNLPLFASSAQEDFAAKLAKDDARRRRKLDNRMEWLIMSALSTGQLAYNDGKIKFGVDYGRPAAQQGSNAANDLAGYVTDGVTDWSGTTHDPVGFFTAVDEFMYETYGVHLDRVVGSRKAFNKIMNSSKFAQLAGLGGAVQPGGTLEPPDLNYLMQGWGPQAARDVVTRATGISLIEADAVYRTRAIGSNTIVSTRFWPQNRLMFLPSLADLDQIDDTDIGFGKTLTSPHPEGNWTAGFYEWETPLQQDPWGLDRGAGIKAFPVFPHMEYTYVVDLVL